MSSILTNFLLMTSILFIIPKLFERIKVPAQSTEIFLGIFLGISLPAIFFENELYTILGTIGIICFFIYSGIEADLHFIKLNKRLVAESLLIRLFLISVIFFATSYFFGFGLKKSGLIALALITPSAGFILTSIESFKLHDETKKFIQAKVVAAEMICVILLVFFFYADNPLKAILVTSAVLLWTIILPYIVIFVYEAFFDKIINVEFPLVFFIGLISAFFTEFLGLHFLLGAFIAGIFIENFLHNLHQDMKIKNDERKNITETFKFISYIFLPFYFFSIGLRIKPDLLNPRLIFIAMGIFIIISAISLIIHYSHRRLRFEKDNTHDLQAAILMLPTLMFTIIIADILLANKIITLEIFSILLYYAIFSSFLPIVAKMVKRQHF
jgi:Kef-type K+ transport system membrane component KefB